MAIFHEIEKCLESQGKINKAMLRSEIQNKQVIAALVGFLIDNKGITLEQAAEIHRIMYAEEIKE